MTLVLVEGPSDARAIGTLAGRRGIDLTAAGGRVQVLGGITNLAKQLTRTGTDPVLVLHDAGEADYVRRVVARVGAPVRLYCCEADLEDELIRALGVPAVLEVVEAAGDRQPWETLTRQPFHRGRSAEVVLRRFMGTTSGRKLRYAGLLVEAGVELDRVPPPLVALLSDVTAAGGGATT
jgi:hypothetical protein